MFTLPSFVTLHYQILLQHYDTVTKGAGKTEG